MIGIAAEGGLQHAFVRALRHAALEQLHVAKLRSPVLIEQRVNARGVFRRAAVGEDHVHHAGGLHGPHARDVRDGRRVLARKALRGFDVDIIPARFVHVAVAAFFHIGRGGEKPGEEARAQRDDKQNGQEPVQAPADAAQDVSPSHSFHCLPLDPFHGQRAGVRFRAGNGAVFDVNDAVGDLREGAVMRDDEHGLARLPAGILQKLEHLLAGVVI